MATIIFFPTDDANWWCQKSSVSCTVLMCSRQNLQNKNKEDLAECIGAQFWNPDLTVRSDRENLEPFIFAVLLTSRTTLWEKSRDPYKPQSNLTVLRTVIRPLLTVSCFPLNLNLKNKNKNIKKKHTHTKKQKKKKHNCRESRKHGCSSKATTPAPDSRRHDNAPPTSRLALFFFFFWSSKPLSLL